MAEPLSSLIRPDARPVLPAFERFAPGPPESLVAAELEARTSAGDIVLELHGRGGWVARAAIDRLRRVYDVESTELTRMLATVVLRPPDLRHFDAAVNALAIHPRGDVGLRRSLEDLYASRCASCSRSVIVDEFVWDGDAGGPTRKSYRCPFCREHARNADQRGVPTDRQDAERARAADDGPTPWTFLRERFPTPDDDDPLPDQLLGLYTTRNAVAIAALVERLDLDLRAPPIQAALRLALLHVLLPASRLNSYPGRMATLRVVHGRLKPPGERQWRERNVWSLFEEGCRYVRSFVQRLESAPGGTIQARLGDDLLALVDGSANVVVKRGAAAAAGVAPALPADRAPLPGRLDARSRVRLVLTQAPVRWSAENLSFAYLATALTLGREAASSLPLEALFGAGRRSEWAWEASALRRSLAAVRPVLAPDASAVVMLDRGGPQALVAGVLGGVGAGYSLDAALLAEIGDEIGGILEFSPPGRSDRAGTDVASLRDLTRSEGPFQLSAVERAVADVAVAVLQERGEPARFERMLGEVLIGLDRLGHLQRLVGTQTYTETERRAEASAAAVGVFGDVSAVAGPLEGAAATDAPPVAAPDQGGERPAPRARLWPLDPRGSRTAAEVPRVPPHALPQLEATHDAGSNGAAGAPAPPTEAAIEPDPESGDDAPGAGRGPVPDWRGEGSAGDHVKLLMEIVLGGLRRPDHPRLHELEPGRWWLRDPADIEAARPPISDRLEWAVFSLLSTSGGLTVAAFFDRIARMFRGHDTPDEELVRACLDSYRSLDGPSEPLRTDDELQARSHEHGELVGMLAEYGHRLGLRVWIARREQRRTFKGRLLSELLSDAEERVYLPLVTPGGVEALESTDCIWYLRGKATFLFEVEWTAMLSEPLLRRGPRITTTDTLVRFLVIPPERTELVRLKLARSPLLREAMERDNWHILKSDHLRRLYAHEDADLDALGPFLGLDPDIERQGEQLALFS